MYMSKRMMRKQMALRTEVMMSVIPILLVVALTGMLMGCQSMQTQQSTPQQTAAQQVTRDAPVFKITGKIGVVYVDATGKKHSGSAFFAWVQQHQRFAIDLTGALGIGKTYIEGTEKAARLISQKTGEITGDSPEDILYQATRWHAPISMLPHWILAQTTDNHTETTYDAQGRLHKTREQNWQATLFYRANDTLPYKLKMQDDVNNKVIITLQTRE